MTRPMTSTAAVAAALSLLAALPAAAQDDFVPNPAPPEAAPPEAAPPEAAPEEAAAEPEDEICVQAPEPVISLDYGSRYTAESEDRSDIDEEAYAEVEKALGPVDDFIEDLARGANRAQRGNDDSAEAAGCVVEAIHVWAEAGALSDLLTMNAQISSPSRLAGIAMAYALAKPHVASPDPARQEVVEAWLGERMRASMAYFDSDEAPTNASRNNLRAWAGFAAAAVAEATGDQEIADWGAGTVELVACQADEDGALPLEMARGPRALQYQLHAVAPLVVTAAMLSDESRDLFELCDGAIHRIVDFVPAAFGSPELVEEKAGEHQTYFAGDDELEAFELAWAEAYLSRFDDPDLAAFVESYRPLGNSKLGGNQELLWGTPDDASSDGT